MAVALRSVGSLSQSTTTGFPTMPSGWQPGDLLILFVETANQAVTTPSGWTPITTPAGTGTAAGTTATRMTVYYRIAQSGDSSPTIADPGDHILSCIAAFTGHDATTPIDAFATGTRASSGSVIATGLTTVTDNALVVYAVAMAHDSATGAMSGWSNAGLADVTEIIDYNSLTGNGGLIGVATGRKVTAGATGTMSATAAVSAVQSYMTFAIRPEPPVALTATSLATSSPAFGTPTAGEGPAPPEQWDSGSRGSAVTLSNGNLTATVGTVPGGGVFDGVRSLKGHTGGRWAFSFTPSGSFGMAGFARSSQSLNDNNFLASSDAEFFYSNGGSLSRSYNNSINGYGWFTLSAGVKYHIAVDLDAKLMWIKDPATGYWNGDSNYSPDSGTGGVDMGMTTGPWYVFYGFNANSQSVEFHLNDVSHGLFFYQPWNASENSGRAVQASSIYETGLNPSKPAGTVSGDLLLASVLVMSSDLATTITAPSGWTVLGTSRLENYSGFAGLRSTFYYKVAGGSEPTNYTWSATGTLYGSSVSLLRVKGVHSTPIVASDDAFAAQGSSAVSFDGVTTTEYDSLVIYMANASGDESPSLFPNVGPSGVPILKPALSTGAGIYGYQRRLGAGSVSSVTAPTANTLINHTATVVIKNATTQTAPADFLSASGLETSSPALGTPSMNQTQALSATNLVTSSPSIPVGLKYSYISLVGTSTASGTSITLPAHEPDDLILVYAFRDGNTTNPTLPTGWANVESGGANASSYLLAIKLADSNSETATGFTNATMLIAAVYRSVRGRGLLIGGVTANTGSSTTVTYPASDTYAPFAFADSIIAAFSGHRSTNTALENPPTGMFLRDNRVDGSAEVSFFDTGEGVLGTWPSSAVSVGGSSSGWQALAVEIIEDDPNQSRFDPEQTYNLGVVLELYSPDQKWAEIISWEGTEESGFEARVNWARYPNDPYPKRVYAFRFDSSFTEWSGMGLGSWLHDTIGSENVLGANAIFYNRDAASDEATWVDSEVAVYPNYMGQNDWVLVYVNLATGKIAFNVGGTFVNGANPNTGVNCLDWSEFIDRPELGVWPVAHFGSLGTGPVIQYSGAEFLIETLRTGLSNESDYIAWDAIPAPKAVRWSEDHKGVNIHLANDGQKVNLWLRETGTFDRAVRANVGYSSGKRVFAVYCHETKLSTEDAYSAIGLMTGDVTNFNQHLTASGTEGTQIGYWNDGEVYGETNYIGTGPTFDDRSIVYFAVDITNRKLWIKSSHNGLWNNSGTANPDTGVGGINIPSGELASGTWYPAISLGNVEESYTLMADAPLHGLSTFLTWDFDDSAPAALTATNLVTGSPVLGTPTLGIVSSVADLTASAIATGAAVLGTPSLGQTHVLSATGITTSSPVLGTPSTTQTQVLSATDLATSSAVLGTPSVGQKHSLSATNLTTSSAELGTPSLARIPNLTATNLSTSGAALGTPSIAQVHALSATALTTSSPALDTPSMTRVVALAATELTTSGAVLGTPSLGQTNSLTATGLETASPVLGTPTAVRNIVFTATGLTTSSAVLGTPSVFQTHVLSASSLTTTEVVIGTPSAAIISNVTASALTTSSPVLGTPSLTQNHALTATSLTTQSPFIQEVDFLGNSEITGSDLTTASPALGSPSLGQKHVLTATSLTTSSASLGSPALVMVVPVAATNLTVGAPVFGTPALTQQHALSATAITAQSPALGTPSIGQKHVLSATSLETLSPVLGTPSTGQSQVLTATGLTTVSPVLGTPSVGQTQNLSATNLTTGSPSLGTTSIGQTHALSATDLSTQAPSLGNAVLAQNHDLSATSIATSGPEFGSTIVTQAQALYLNSLTTSSPAIGTPSVAQTHVLTATGVTTASPVIGVTTSSQIHNLTASALTTSSPVIGTPVMRRVVALEPESLNPEGSVELGTPEIGQYHHLTTGGMFTSVPSLGTPSMLQTNALTANGLTTARPDVPTGVLKQRHPFTTSGVTTGSPSLGTPVPLEIKNFSAVGITTSSPVLGTPTISQRHLFLATSLSTATPVIGAPIMTNRTNKRRRMFFVMG